LFLFTIFGELENGRTVGVFQNGRPKRKRASGGKLYAGQGEKIGFLSFNIPNTGQKSGAI
jgi:hypothetical protein